MVGNEVASVSLKHRVLAALPSGMRTMARDSVWTLAFEMSLLLSVTASFILLGRELGTARYGEYIGLFAITTPLSAVGSASMLAAMQYMFAEEKAVPKVMGIFITTALLGGSVAMVAAVALAVLTLPSLSIVAILAMALGEIILVPLARVVGAGVRALHGVPASVRLQLSILGARLAVLISIFVVGELTIQRLAIGWFFSNLAIVSWMILVVMPRDGVPIRLVRVHFRDFRVAGALGAPIFVSDFQTNGDKVVLNSAGLESEAGLYGAAFRIVSMALTPLRAMDVAVFHRFLQSDESAYGQHTRRARLYSMASLAVITPIALVLLVLAPQLEFILGAEFSDSVEMMRWLLLWLPIRAVSGAPLNGMLGLGRLGLRFGVLLLGAATAMTIYILVIPGTGWEGAVFGTVVAEIVVLVVGWAALIGAQRRHDRRLRASQTLPADAVPHPSQ